MASHYTPEIEVSINGAQELGGHNFKWGHKIKRIQVDQRLDAPDYFSLDLDAVDAKGSQNLIFVDELKLGMEVKIKLGYGEPADVFQGEISYIEPRFADGVGVVTISGYDFMHRLTRGTSSRTWGDGHEPTDKLSEIAQAVISDSKARKGGTSDGLSADSEAHDTKAEYIPQVEVNDYAFIRSLGIATGRTTDSRNNADKTKVKFRSVDTSAEPKLKVYRDKRADTDVGAYARSADFTMSTVRQVAKVEVRSWSAKDKKAILGKAEAAESLVPSGGSPGYTEAGKAHYSSGNGRVLTIIDHPVADEAEATAVAKAIFESLSMEFIRAEVEVEGAPGVAAGDIVEVNEFGTAFDGAYVVEAASHLIDAALTDTGPYTTRLTLVRNCSGG